MIISYFVQYVIHLLGKRFWLSDRFSIIPSMIMLIQVMVRSGVDFPNLLTVGSVFSNFPDIPSI